MNPVNDYQINVLLVDDEKNIRNSLQRLLKGEPYRTFFVESGEEALRKIESEKIHVVLTDLNMPHMNGIELLNRISISHPDIIRLILSGNSESTVVLSAINSGDVYRYLLKPWDNDELKIILSQAIDVYITRREKKRLVKKLEDYNTRLEEMVKKRTDQLISIKNAAEIGKHTSYIVHNIKNSIHGLSGALFLMETLDDDMLSDELPKYLKLTNETIENLKNTVSEILLFSTSPETMNTQDVNINDQIRQIDHLFQMFPDYKNKTKKIFDLDPDLPVIHCNPMHIRQILDNLFKNSIDAMEESQCKELHVSTGTVNGMIRLTIKDCGCGIPDDQLKKIYLPEFTTKPVGKGTGLGLASVVSMVKSFKGSIDVTSKPGEGTKFVIQLPFKREESI